MTGKWYFGALLAEANMDPRDELVCTPAVLRGANDQMLAKHRAFSNKVILAVAKTTQQNVPTVPYQQGHTMRDIVAQLMAYATDNEVLEVYNILEEVAQRRRLLG